MQIDPQGEYTPRQISNEGWIKNTVGKADYYFVKKIINRGLLKARNLNPDGKIPAYQVKGQSIIDYLNG